MRRGQDHRPTHSESSSDPANGFTKQELLDASGLSPKTFDTIRKAARVRGPGHGGLDWLFSLADVVALVQRAESGTFTERGAPAAAAWRELLGQRGVSPPRRT
jgi:hypothetical protein